MIDSKIIVTTKPGQTLEQALKEKGISPEILGLLLVLGNFFVAEEYVPQYNPDSRDGSFELSESFRALIEPTLKKLESLGVSREWAIENALKIKVNAVRTNAQ
jgi:hypothetical protein